QVAPVEQDLAAGDPARGLLDETEQRERRDALARPGLAHHPERLLSVEVERHAVHGAHEAVVGGELDGEVPDLEKMSGAVHRRGAAHSFGPPEPLIACGSRASRSASPRQLTASTVSTIMRPGKIV